MSHANKILLQLALFPFIVTGLLGRTLSAGDDFIGKIPWEMKHFFPHNFNVHCGGIVNAIGKTHKGRGIPAHDPHAVFAWQNIKLDNGQLSALPWYVYTPPSNHYIKLSRLITR